MTIKVFASGQSNMVGAGSGGPSMGLVSSSVTVWNNQNPLGGNGSAFVTASAAQDALVFQYANRNNLAVWFCDRLARSLLDTVTLTMVARGSSPISYWLPSEVTYPMLQTSIDVWTATGQDPADVFIWHQGENDAGSDPAYYIGAFMGLVDNLVSAGVISSNAAIIVGGLENETTAKIDFNRTHLLSMCKGRIAYAESFGLKTYDAIHFDGTGLYDFGSRRYFSAYLLAARRSGY